MLLPSHLHDKHFLVGMRCRLGPPPVGTLTRMSDRPAPRSLPSNSRTASLAVCFTGRFLARFFMPIRYARRSSHERHNESEHRPVAGRG